MATEVPLQLAPNDTCPSNINNSNPYIIGDEALSAPSALAFRPWGPPILKEGEEKVPFYRSTSQFNLEPQTRKGKEIFHPEMQRTNVRQ